MKEVPFTHLYIVLILITFFLILLQVVVNVRQTYEIREMYKQIGCLERDRVYLPEESKGTNSGIFCGKRYPDFLTPTQPEDESVS